MNNNLETFAKRLQQARLKAKLSMEKLSEKMNGIVTKQAISKYEKAKMMPNPLAWVEKSLLTFRAKSSDDNKEASSLPKLLKNEASYCLNRSGIFKQKDTLPESSFLTPKEVR